MTYMESYE